MMVKVGDMIPAVKLKRLGANGLEEVDTGELFRGRVVVLFGVPGAFTPTCSNNHLPGYVENSALLKSKGVEEIFCTAVNDPFVMNAWAQNHDVGDAVSMLPDGNGVFARALGLEMDSTAYNFGMRCHRFSLVADSGIIKAMNIDPPGTFDSSSCNVMLKSLWL